MADEDDWQKLSIEDKVVHKSWKARVAGYEEATKRFRLIDSEKSPEYNNFLGIIKKFVVDSNAAAQEKGLEATLSFVENAACASKCCADVISGIVQKVLIARPKSKQLGVNICMMYIEIEKQETVMEELLTGFSHKTPKVIAACVAIVTQALCAFGGKVIMMKGLVKQIPTLLSHSDKNVRAEAKLLAIEIYKWIRDAIKVQLKNIKPVQLKELEDEWEKLDSTPPTPSRFTQSDQAKRAAAPPTAQPSNVSVANSEAPALQAAAAVDPWDIFDPVDILSQMPKDFYEQIESKKWQDRKEAMEALDKLTSTPRIEPGQYGEVCAVLKKIITKDTNVMVVALAGKCVTGLACGLRKKFQTYSGLLVPAIFGKFKEKKLNVVIALRDAIDAVFATTNFNNIMEDLLAALDNKNPQIKEETCKFLTRTFSTSPVSVLPKQALKLIVPAVLKKLDDTAGPVRDAAAETLGTAMKLVGERALAAYLDPLDKIKQDKVKEFFEKAETLIQPGTAPAPSKPPGSAAPPAVKKELKQEVPADDKPPVKKQTKKPAGAGKKAVGKVAAGQKGKKKKKGNTFEEDLQEPSEPEMPEGVVECQAEELFGDERVKQMSSSNWKERLEAVDEMTKTVEALEDGKVPSQVVVRTLARKPGWKDSNFQVMNGKFKLLAITAKKSDFTRRSAWFAIAGLISKIGDIKLKTQVKETLKIFAENISLNYISLKIAKSAEEAKNPKLQTEALIWMSEAVKEFGFRIDLKPHIAFIKLCLANTNPGVRKAAIDFLATLHIFVGPKLCMFFEDEKPALLQQIDVELEKVKDEKTPAPTRKFVDDEEEEEDPQDDDVEDEGSGGAAVNLEDMVDRVSISEKLTESVLAKIMDKNWKIRKEGLEEVTSFINEAKFIKPELNELPTSLKARLADNNKVLVQMTIGICKQLAECGGSGMGRHKNTILPALIGTLSDAKPAIRKQGEEALDAWHSKIGFLPFIEGEILSTALTSPNPNLKATLLTWLERILPNERKLPAELKESIPPLLACLEDRNPDVRKASSAAVPFFMAHIGYEPLCKAANKLDPSSKAVVQGVLEKAKEVCVPIAAPGKKVKGGGNKAGAAQVAKSAALAAAAASSAMDGDTVSVQREQPSKKKKETGKSDNKKAGGKVAATNRKKDVVEDDGPAIIMKVGKAQRIKDEKNLKVLKWNFTSPRDEIVEQLKDQMAPCFSPSMHAKLFNKDFKLHIDAIAILVNCVSQNPDAVFESLDLILKWVSLRFFDTNTSVLLKALEFVTVLFQSLQETGRKLTNFEASAFIPYLILKVGDPKDNVRRSVREICKLITPVYPASQLFVHLLECCEELGFLIAKFGIDVCQPSPKVLKEIAAQIADRDNGVRSAALNCIVEAYNIMGDQVYKFIGRLNDKEMGYLEERIKRSANKKEAPGKQQQTVKARQPTKPTKDGKNPMDILAHAKDELAKSAPAAPQIKREFQLDFRAIEGDEDVITGSVPQLKNVNIDDIAEAAQIPESLLKAYSSSANKSMNNSMKDVSELLDLTIAKISSSDNQAAMESLVQLEDVFRKRKTDAEILKRIDQYLVTSLVQLKMLFSRHVQENKIPSEEHERLLKLLLSGMIALFDAQCYASVVSHNVLKDVIMYFITILNDKILMSFEEPELSIQCVNRLILRVITNSDKTACLCSCVQLLQDLSENNNPVTSLVKLVMKCIWKLTHLLPDFIEEVRLPAILQSIHSFYTVLPPAVWRTRSDRVPQQTVKALLQTLCKLRGDQLFDCLSSLEDTSTSEVPQFIMKHCSKGKTEGFIHVPTRLGQPSNEVLVEIFKKIGSKENSRAGILELHHFKQNYPDYDVNPFIKNTSPFFQNFIERSLKTIASEERLKVINNDDRGQPVTAITNSTSETAKYMDRLRILKEQFQKTSQAASTSDEQIENEPEPCVETKANVVVVDSLQPVDVKDEESQKLKNFDLDDIKKRLALIKGSR